MQNIQTGSIIVPPKKGEGCLNRCKFGVCFQNRNKYENRLQESSPGQIMYAWDDYTDRMNILREQHVDTVILTGDIEPMGNMDFIELFSYFNKRVISSPFKNIELQTAGNKLDNRSLNWLRNIIGVKTISLSLSSFDNLINQEITQSKELIDIKTVCTLIKQYGFNLRLSLNMNKIGFSNSFGDILDHVKYLMADQLTIRYLYEDGTDSKPSTWTRDNRTSLNDIKGFKGFIKQAGTLVGMLPYGAKLYSWKGISIAIDDDCMAEDLGKDIKYLVLGPDAKLYRDWNKTLYC